jgi:hypothetical protein
MSCAPCGGLPQVNIVGVREAGGQPDPEVLASAATKLRVLLGTRSKRVARYEPMPGVIAVHQRLPIGDVGYDLLLRGFK